jgi:hypothetical protein
MKHWALRDRSAGRRHPGTWSRGHCVIPRPAGNVVANNGLILPVRRLVFNGLEAWAQMLERSYQGWSRRTRREKYVGAGRDRGSR